MPHLDDTMNCYSELFSDDSKCVYATQVSLLLYLFHSLKLNFVISPYTFLLIRVRYDHWLIVNIVRLDEYNQVSYFVTALLHYKNPLVTW